MIFPAFLKYIVDALKLAHKEGKEYKNRYLKKGRENIAHSPATSCKKIRY
jgi:hypothetical protein